MRIFIPLVLVVSMLSTYCSTERIFNAETIQQLAPAEYVARLKQELLDSNLYIIDVRTGVEFNQRHIEGAVNIDFLGGQFGEICKHLDTDRTVFLYCQTAHRSPFATKKLKKLGFKKIYDLEGGFKNLMNSNLDFPKSKCGQ